MQENDCVLIVDDNELERETIKLLLLPENYQLAFAKNGFEALQQAASLKPDLILLDIMMLEMDGFEVCQQLRAKPELAEIPVILLTAPDDRETRLRGLEVGADDFINKPFDKVELLTRVRAILRLNRYRHLVVERSRFEWAVEQSNDGYLLLKEGDEIQYANSGARYYLSLLTESSLQEGFWQRVKKLEYRCEPATAWENWPTPTVGGNSRYLVRPETNQSALLWLQIDVLEGGKNDNSRCQLVHLRDVSEQMNLQQQMWTFQTLVSHKLRAPLNGLVGLQILNDKNINLSSEKTTSLLNIARESAKRLQNQILDILRYIDSSQVLQQSKSFNLSDLSSLITVISKELELDQITLHVEQTMLTQSLRFSTQGMELILRELLTNAKKFHPQQTPTINISLTPTVDNKFTNLQFIDDGKHLPSKAITKVWTPYYQNEAHFTGEVKGMGLGLAMVARLVWSSGGQCRLWNREEKPGIVVELTLPLVTD
jgi:DNA-binding response OmpR family regulator/two-component sensor histidine kinase